MNMEQKLSFMDLVDGYQGLTFAEVMAAMAESGVLGVIPTKVCHRFLALGGGVHPDPLDQARLWALACRYIAWLPDDSEVWELWCEWGVDLDALVTRLHRYQGMGHLPLRAAQAMDRLLDAYPQAPEHLFGEG